VIVVIVSWRIRGQKLQVFAVSPHQEVKSRTTRTMECRKNERKIKEVKHIEEKETKIETKKTNNRSE
jgi:hypothetical protein